MISSLTVVDVDFSRRARGRERDRQDPEARKNCTIDLDTYVHQSQDASVQQ
jgi:hypothetical protein